MRVCAISDLHGHLPKIESCDLLLICGDIMPLSIQANMPASEQWLTEVFLPWTENIPVEKVIMVAGNHDFFMERSARKAKQLLNTGKLTYLENESIDFISDEGQLVKIFGTPYCKIFGNWAFMRGPEYLASKYSEIPEGVDILISHDAPRIGNVGAILEGPWRGEDAGNAQLAEAIMTKKPKYCFCGHIHSGEHELTELGNIKLYNVSIMNERYTPVNKPLYVEI